MFNLSGIFKKSAPISIKPVVLLILDGWGLAPNSPGNAITSATVPNMEKLNGLYPHGVLLAAGESVGLPANEVGNTEVGHINLGAGRIVLQDLKRISKTIEDGTFFDNRTIRKSIDYVKKNSSKLHIAGLVGTGNVHSSLDHFWALLEFCRKQNLKSVYLHLFTDGRDTPPQEAKAIIRGIQDRLKLQTFGSIATISGRYYAMDRDRRWDRTSLTYEAMTQGVGIKEIDPEKAIMNAYARGETDEFVKPVVISGPDGIKPLATVDDNDALIMFNFRIDRPRQLTQAFVMPDFEKQSFPTFQRKKVVKNLFVITMTEYQKDLPVGGIAFPPEQVETPLAEVISKGGLKQLHMAESEKRRFITYYFNGLRQENFPGEESVIVPSPRVPTYDKKPEMSVVELTNEFKKWIAKGQHRFIVINFANPDMVAHTGNLQATIKAVEFVDKAVGEVVTSVLNLDGTLIITGDHGNAEELLTYPPGNYFFTSAKGVVNTDHSNSPVPVIIVNRSYEGKTTLLKQGILGDIAPTILDLLGLQRPPVMTGRNLLK